MVATKRYNEQQMQLVTLRVRGAELPFEMARTALPVVPGVSNTMADSVNERIQLRGRLCSSEQGPAHFEISTSLKVSSSAERSRST